MVDLSVPWLSLLVAIPAAAAFLPRALLVGRRARRVTLFATGTVLLLSLGAAVEFHQGAEGAARVDRFDPGWWLLGRPLLVVDELSSLLLPFATLVFAVVALVLPRTERHRASTRRLLASEAVTIAVFLTTEPALLAILWTLSALVAHRELRLEAASRSRVPAESLYLLLSVALFAAGAVLEYVSEVASPAGKLADGLLLAAILTRKGIVPFHSWMGGFFERMSLPSAILFSAPQIGAYAGARLIVPHAPDSLLTVIGVASLATGVYGAGLALVQSSARRAFGAFFMSQSALVMAGLDSRSPIGLAGGLALWISSGLALTGFGLTIAALEARRGPLTLRTYSGGYERTPLLATCFLILGLAGVGFPGTLGFVSEEALIDGMVADFPQFGVAVMLTSALNGLLVLRAYFRLFGGARLRVGAHQVTRPRERAGFLVLVGLLLALGLSPREFFASRYRAAEAIFHLRYGERNVIDRGEPALLAPTRRRYEGPSRLSE